MRSRATQLLLSLALAALPTFAVAQDFGFDAPASAADPALQATLRDLAQRVLPVYQEDDPDRYLANTAALQLLIADPTAAHATRQTLKERQQSAQGASREPSATIYDVYVEARALEASEGGTFAESYARVFRETFMGLDDLVAYEVGERMLAPLDPLRATLNRLLERHSDASSISLEAALELVQAWLAFDAASSVGALIRPLLAAERERRYVYEEPSIPVADEATVSAALVRPRSTSDASLLPTLLEFTLDAASGDPYEAAAHGYVSLLAGARIASASASGPRAPFESEGQDARAVIAWIAMQPWSDGRVAMQGTGYGGYVAWSAAKVPPSALKAIVTTDPMAPGIDFPTRNRIFLNSSYRWLYRLLAPADDEVARDDERWTAIDEDWYRSGRRYRDYAELPGRASAVFRSWLNHPSYDRFWQKWVPFGDEFARIDIPVLTLTGYYSAGAPAALYYFAEHHRHAEDANHALLIGPFDERALATDVTASIRGLRLDSAARRDLDDVRYAWLAHALRGAERPTLVGSAVNYELSGANEWRHATSLAALEANSLRFYLAAAPTGEPHVLSPLTSAAPMSLTETVDFRDRSELPPRSSDDLVLGAAPLEGLRFLTEPFGEAIALTGRLRGELDFTINKYDVDLALMLYEVRADGVWVKLFEPPFAFRASYARDRVNRRLLVAGVRQQLPFESNRMVGRELSAGSRLALTLGINRRVDQQINYGGTNDVSEESIDVAGSAVRIRWHEGSFIEIASPLSIDSASSEQPTRSGSANDRNDQ